MVRFVSMGNAERLSKLRPWRRYHWPWATDPVVERKLDRIIAMLEHLTTKGEADMSKISDLIAECKVELAGVQARIIEDVANYEARIAQLQQQVDEGTATPQDLADLAELKATLAGLDPTNPNVLPTVPPEPVVP